MLSIYEGMNWMKEPKWGFEGKTLWVQTAHGTDFWQRTHYGFRHDNAHAFVQEVAGNFRLRARFRFHPNAQYDQCGLLLRADENCWFKCSVEYEDAEHSRLGSVLTNHGYSDWATQDISSQVNEMVYDIEVKESDIVVRNSYDGADFHQLRIAHLEHFQRPLLAGFYGCSPIGEGFRFEVLEFNLERLWWI